MEKKVTLAEVALKKDCMARRGLWFWFRKGEKGLRDVGEGG